MSLIVGRKPVLEAINSGEQIEQVYFLYGQQGGIVDVIRIAAKKRGIKCSEVQKDRFDALVKNQNSQGVAARKAFQKFYTAQEIIKYSRQKKYPLVLLLDQIQDPHNLGAILRTAECSGVDGVFITRHNSASVNDTVVKTSAGATEHIMICVVNNISQMIKELKENGFWIVGSTLSESVDYTEVDYKIPTALIMGNEEKGIRKLTADLCDYKVKIPMSGKIQSLNVSVASGIILFELNRQRKI
ncbi:MAG: 23S rRNA (guanosine(2251)-2'-O)-methyltransferase RlmB [Ignavibacteriales bacterium]|nr:MAG: 23S rRNA (guanosine(2251)-2'-O)-methyltransferase RlmB [Ignavibacteriales bacterium]